MATAQELDERRRRSVTLVAAAGLRRPPAHLPVVDGTLSRTADAAVRRLGTLSAIAAVAHGCPVTTAEDWLRQEAIWPAVAASERVFLTSPAVGGKEAETPEAVFVLAWSLGLVHIDNVLTDRCPDDLVRRVPHPPPAPMGVSDIRPVTVQSAAVVDALDALYCAHWALVEGQRRGDQGTAIEASAVVQRRHALEWLVGDEDWDGVQLDT